MLNPFGADYTPHVVWVWLSRDPSLPCAVVIATLVWFIGKRIAAVKILVAPVFSSFLPLSLWIWDIPFTGRFICRHFHDGRLIFPGGIPISARYFYALGLLLYLVFTLAAFARKGRIGERD
jgi:hypothetical protein